MDTSQPTLADLINDRKGTRSYERLSRDAGGYPTRNRFFGLASEQAQTKFPDPATLQGVARALSVPLSEVVLAAARSVGLSVPPTDPSVLVIAGAGSLSPEARDMILNLARDLIRAAEMTGGAHVKEDLDPPDSAAVAAMN